MNKYNIILFIVIIIILYYFKNVQETFDIVNVYPYESDFGIGDYMRGIIHLYQTTNWNDVHINYSDNEISKYLYNETNTNYKTKTVPIKTDEKSVFHNGLNIVHHNARIEYPIDEKILIQVRKMFTMKPEFKKYFLQRMNELGLKDKNFVVIHLRYVDDVFNNDKVKSNKRLDDKIKQIVTKHKNILILSNSKIMKESIALKYKLKYFDIIPIHTGYIHSSVIDRIKDTLVEFFSMTYSTKIFQYCEDKNQVSGFSQRVSEIFNVPIEII